MADAAATEGNDAVTELDDDACWSLLETQALGRIAISAERLEIFPVNYLVHDRSIYFSSAPGSKLMDLAENPSVAFEVDGTASADLWSVVVHGRAKRLARDEDIEASGILQHPGWHPTAKYNYIRILPEEVTGRRFARPKHRKRSHD